MFCCDIKYKDGFTSVFDFHEMYVVYEEIFIDSKVLFYTNGTCIFRCKYSQIETILITKKESVK